MPYQIKFEDSDKMGAFLGQITTACEKTEKIILKESGQAIKRHVVDNLSAIRSKDNEDGHIHMADDVVVSTRKDEFGYNVVRVHGGKNTGTLWHLVNDGTYKTQATHFMDNAMESAEAEIEAIIDRELGREFK